MGSMQRRNFALLSPAAMLMLLALATHSQTIPLILPPMH
jgi:hypothetical protein